MQYTIVDFIFSFKETEKWYHVQFIKGVKTSQITGHRQWFSKQMMLHSNLTVPQIST